MILRILHYLIKNNSLIPKAIQMLQSEFFEDYSKVYNFIVESYENDNQVSEVDIILKFSQDLANKITETEIDLFPGKFEIYLAKFFDDSQSKRIDKMFDSVRNLSIDDKLDKLQIELDRVNDDYIKLREKDKTFFDVLNEVYADLNDKIENGNHTSLQINNLPSLNESLGGVMPVDLFAIYGKEKSAKTTLATSIGLDWALEQGIPGAIFSLEVSRNQMLWKTISMKTGIDFIKLRDPYRHLSKKELNDNAYKMSKYSNKKLWVFDDIDTETGIRAKTKELIPLGCKWIIVDYLMLIDSTIHRNNLREELNYLTRYFKMKVAKKLNIPVILISQANEAGTRGAEGKGLERDSDYFVYIMKGDGKTRVDFQTINGNKYNDYLLGENEYIAKVRGVRHAKSGDSVILTFVNNNFVEKDLEHECSF